MKKVVLCILDGWGVAPHSAYNAIALASTPHFHDFLQKYSHALLQASGKSVGLPDGQMGNSEVGHMTIGSGRVIDQDLPKITKAIAAGHLESLLRPLAAKVREQTGLCHVMGLLSPGGVHSHQNHLIACAKELARQGVKVSIHAFLDGRDTPPMSATGYVQELMDAIKDEPLIVLNTLSGRYFAMDRDRRWERVQKAFDALVLASGPLHFHTPQQAIAEAYQKGLSDEFFPPSFKEGYEGIQPQDGLLMVNFRADRSIQWLTSLSDDKFDCFDRRGFLHTGPGNTMVFYNASLAERYPPLFPPVNISHTLGETIAQAGLKQLRLAETEKFAHVTYFFNAGRQEAWQGEDRLLIPSPPVSTYDLQPKMAALEITEHLLKYMKTKDYSLIVVNYANADMVGHSGNLPATCQAIEALDLCLGEIEKCALKHNWTVVITSDHGNAERMYDEATRMPHTAHTTNLVPCILIQPNNQETLRSGGELQDIAVTILALMGLQAPMQMEGKSLLDNSKGIS